ncbi:MAG: toxic anion resistance protein [Clostridia bacterium]|nr:toxic anion resistance protein [Clostridia bacterium]
MPSEAAPAQAAPVQSIQQSDIPAAPAAPDALPLSLGLNTPAAAPAAAPAQAKPAIPEIKETEILEAVETLTPAERSAIDAFKAKLDITNPDHVMLYGADAQKSLGEFSTSALEAVRTKDAGEVGKMLEDLVVELRGFETDAEEPKGLFRIFSKASDRIERMKTRYGAVSVNVENIKTQLEAHMVQLQEDVKMFDRMYERNLAYFRQLTLYIIAGQETLKHVRETDLRAAYEKAAGTGDAMDAQSANDLAALCDRFEKKLHDLLLTRQVALQTGPQIRLLQNNDQLLIERIQSTIANTLPLWQNQMVLALGMHNAQQALKAQRAVTDMTNELLRKNAAALQQGTVETAREAERGIIDIETLVETNQSLIDTIDQVLQIQREGRAKRSEAEKTLREMETHLRAKLLETSSH